MRCQSTTSISAVDAISVNGSDRSSARSTRRASGSRISEPDAAIAALTSTRLTVNRIGRRHRDARAGRRRSSCRRGTASAPSPRARRQAEHAGVEDRADERVAPADARRASARSRRRTSPAPTRRARGRRRRRRSRARRRSRPRPRPGRGSARRASRRRETPRRRRSSSRSPDRGRTTTVATAYAVMPTRETGATTASSLAGGCARPLIRARDVTR